MNSNLNRALAAALTVFGGVAPALAQIDSDSICIDPNNSTPYSNDFLFNLKTNKFFGASVGLAGTVAYQTGAYCLSGGPIRGRIGFTIGTEGSIYDASETLHDDNLRLTKGANFLQQLVPANAYPGLFLSPSVGGASFARVYVRHTTTAGAVTTDNFLFGSNAINLSFSGRGGRYIYVETTVGGTAANNSVNARLLIDVLGDTARLGWRLTNNLQTTDTIGLGLYFGQVVQLIEENTGFRSVHYGPPATNGNFTDGFDTVYMTIPGRRPLSVDERFPDPDPNPLTRTSTAVPPYINFSINRRLGYGLQVVNNPSVLTSIDPTSGTDQTPVDEFTIGQPPFVIDGRFNATDPQFGDFIFNAPGNGNDDAAPLAGDPAYLQKWLPNVVVAPGDARSITGYYRSTNFDSSYSPQFSGYTALVDTPKSISTNASIINDPNNPFTPNPFTIRVNVDNTGGFTNPDTQVTMSSVDVVLHLPAGMSNPADGSRTVTKSLGNVAPNGIAFTDFQVKVDPNLFGAQTYSVDITPNPGFRRKTITGTINVATAPRLLVRSGPNLVSPPWEYTDASWESVLGLTLNTDFQAYKWDARQQKYVTQLNAERAVGSFIVSPNDRNYIALGGTPRQPRDEFPSDDNLDVSATGTSPTVPLYTGWNLVGNPYNYAFPLGQIIGIPRGGQANNRSLTFEQLVAGQFTNGSFSYYDATTGEYRSIAGRGASRLQPNYGYWIYVNQDVDLQFPPIYELFIRSGEPTEAPQRFDNWKLQLAAATVNSRDTQNFVGIVRDPADVSALSIRKAPMPPPLASRNTVYAYVTGDTGASMSSSVRRATGTQTFKYNVFTQAKGPVTVSWPNLKSIPSNLQVSITDTQTKKTVDARKSSGYTFTATGTAVRAFTVKVTAGSATRERIASVSYSVARTAVLKEASLRFAATARGAATIDVYRGSVRVASIAKDMDIVAGSNATTWPFSDLSGHLLAAGNYTLKISATGEGGDTATYQGTITVPK